MKNEATMKVKIVNEQLSNNGSA